jgi:hypothetical protein
MSRSNGGIIGKVNDPTNNVANGIWSLAAAEKAKRGGNWPNIFSGTALRLDFNETTTLDSRITFTRATNGTYFDSSGVLQTASSDVARFDHRLEGGVWVNKGLLMEEQRANVNIYSEEFDNAAWTNTNVTITANDETAPDGNTTADAIVENTTNSSHSVARNNAATGISANTQYTASAFVKKGTRNWCIIGLASFSNYVGNPRAWFDLDNGVVGTLDTGADAAAIQDCGNGWYRCSVTATTVASPGSTSSGTLVGIAAVNGNANYAGTNGAKAIYAWGAQFETGAFPTSYIKTTTASVTRNADVAQMTSTNFSDWFNATEGTVFAQASTFGNPVAVSSRLWEVSDGTSNERYLVSSISGASPAGAIRFGVIDGNLEQSVIDTTFAMAANQTYKTAGCYKVNDFAFSVDGFLIGTDTFGTLPTVNRLYLGGNFAGNSLFLNGHIAKFYYWNTRRPNDTLQGLTS